MLTEPQRLWVEALESGEYHQGKSKLHNITNDTWCCLGVACKVLGINELDGVFGREKTFNILPQEALDILGMSDGGGGYSIDGGITALWIDNDRRNKTFKEIAAIIRSEPEGLFVKPSTEESET